MYSYNSSKFRTMIVVGGRHDYMKAGLLVDAFGRFEDFIDPALIHSGPAFDSASAELFHKTLGLPRPDNFLDITGKSFSELTGNARLS